MVNLLFSLDALDDPLLGPRGPRTRHIGKNQKNQKNAQHQQSANHAVHRVLLLVAAPPGGCFIQYCRDFPRGEESAGRVGDSPSGCGKGHEARSPPCLHLERLMDPFHGACSSFPLGGRYICETRLADSPDNTNPLIGYIFHFTNNFYFYSIFYFSFHTFIVYFLAFSPFSRSPPLAGSIA